jgi:hypothetical protein
MDASSYFRHLGDFNQVLSFCHGNSSPLHWNAILRAGTVPKGITNVYSTVGDLFVI